MTMKLFSMVALTFLGLFMSAQQVKSGTTVASVAEKYIKAIGGRDAVSKVNSITIKATTEVEGMNIDMKIIQAKGGKKVLDMQLFGMSIQKIVFDGQNGYMEAEGEKSPLPSDMKEDLISNKGLFPELNFAKSSAYRLEGIKKYNGENSYVISDENNAYYYSVKTGLKAGEKDKKGETLFSDYRSVSGIKIPFKRIQKNESDVEIKIQSIEINQAKDSDFK